MTAAVPVVAAPIAAVPAVAAPPRPSRESFRTVLGALLNLEWPTRAGALLQPLARGVRPALARTAEQLARNAGLEPASVRSVGDLERLLAAVAPRLPGTSADAAETTVAVPAVPPSLRALAEPGFRRLAAAARALAAATGARCLLHGSLASDDWTGYRDADLLLLVPEGTCADARALRALRCAMLPLLRALYAFDPLQHHGVFAIPAGELTAWPEHWLPVAALRKALDLGGDGLSLAVRPRLDLDAARAELHWLAGHLRAAALPRDAYGWKAFASVVMLAPALWLAASGEPCWKGDSFARVAPLVPEPLWAVQRELAALRADFADPTPGWVRWLLGRAPNPRAVAQLLRRCACLPARLLPADGEGLLRRARAFADHLVGLLPRAAVPG